MNGNNVAPNSATEDQLIPANFIEDVRRRIRKDRDADYLYPPELIELFLSGKLESEVYETMREETARDLVAIVGKTIPEAAAAVVGLWRFGRQAFQDGHTLQELFGRSIDREQHLADLEQLERLTLTRVRRIMEESEQFEVVFRKLNLS